MFAEKRGPGVVELCSEVPLSVHQALSCAIGAINEGDTWDQDRVEQEIHGRKIDQPKAPKFYDFAQRMIGYAVYATVSPIGGMKSFDTAERDMVHSQFSHLMEVDPVLALRVRSMVFRVGSVKVPLSVRTARVENLLGVPMTQKMEWQRAA